jgi:hypothetical protein
MLDPFAARNQAKATYYFYMYQSNPSQIYGMTEGLTDFLNDLQQYLE